MPDNTYSASDRGAQQVPGAQRERSRFLNWFRREPGLATVFLGLAAMILALLLPREVRTLAFYPGVVITVAGTLITLRHGPDRPRQR
jgi:hypothetical protein